MPNIYLIIFLFSKDSINISNKKISIDINIFIHFQLYFYPLMFYRMGRYCLPDRLKKISINKNNKNIFIHFQLYLYPLMFYRMGRYCLPDSCSLLVCDPETSSQVTLTLLGTGFQPDLLFGCLVVWLFVKSVCDNVYQQDNKTTRQQNHKTTKPQGPYLKFRATT